MIKVSEATLEIIENNAFLNFGISNQLLNLSRLALFIKPLVEARIKKEISTTSLIMNLSRLQALRKKTHTQFVHFQISNLTINSNLTSITFYRTLEALKVLSKILSQISEKNGYIAVNQGTSEITLLIDETSTRLIESQQELKFKNKTDHLGSIGIHFSSDYATVPGFLHYVIQQISLQNINIVEISSTYSELIIYLHQKDIKLAFDTLQTLFIK